MDQVIPMRWGLMWVVICCLSARSPASATTMPRQPGEMSVQEVRDEARQLYQDDLPFARYIKAVLDKADEQWPQLDEKEQRVLGIRLYQPVLLALRYERGLITLPQDRHQRQYMAGMRISEALAASGLKKESADFHKELFLSTCFQRSTSAYRIAVIDLWRQFEKQQLQPPYLDLLGLNQWDMGRSAQRGWTLDLQIADLYAQCGQMVTAAQWYEKVPAEGLGPLKAAGAYFVAAQYAEAERLYQFCLAHLAEWRDKQSELRQTALAEPLERMNDEQTKSYITGQLSKIDQIMRSGSQPCRDP